jgi:IS5 family transposase
MRRWRERYEEFGYDGLFDRRRTMRGQAASALDGRTTWHPGYAISQRKRKRIEECFGWLKTIALLRKVRHRGVCKVDWIFTFACAAYNLVRMRDLAAAVPAL